MAFRTIQEVVNIAAKRNLKKRAGVANAADEHTLSAVTKAMNDGIVEPLLIGDENEIKTILNSIDSNIPYDNIINAETAENAAYTTVQLAKNGEIDLILKGKLNTSEILRAVLNKETGLPHGDAVTAVSFAEIPVYDKIVALSDCAIIPYPTLKQKEAQVNAVCKVMHSMGYGDDLKVGILCANENVNPKIIESVEAKKLMEKNISGEIKGCIIEGPISLDIALKKEVAKSKGFDSPCAGDVDALIFPNLACGNIYAKSIEMLPGTVTIGMVVGASVPIGINSRVASVEMKYGTIALTALAATSWGKGNV